MKKHITYSILMIIAICCFATSNSMGQERISEGTQIVLHPANSDSFSSISAEFDNILKDTNPPSSSCEVGNVSNGNNEQWSEECYLNDNCGEQGNPCTANDVNMLGAFLADEFGNPIEICEFEEPTTVYLWGTFQNGTNATRYAVRTRTEIWINGTFDSELNSCSFDLLPVGISNEALIGSFTFSCGDAVEFRSTWVGWDTSTGSQCMDSSADGYTSTCNQYSSSKCSKELTSILLLSPNFAYSCSEFAETTTEVCFQNLTSGGTNPLSYAWDFGDGITSTEENPCHTFNSTDGYYEVTLTVTDSDGVVAAATLPVDLANLFCPNPQLAISKDASLDNCAEEGDQVSFVIVLENTGNQRISNISVSDPMVNLLDENFSLEPGESKTYNPTYSITESDLLDGVINNTVTASGITPAFQTLTVSADKSVEVYSLPTASESIKHVSCNGGNDGEISLTMTGGEIPYSFSWSHDATLNSPHASGLIGGNYQVQITDFNNCELVYDFEITEPANGLSAIISTTDENCLGNESGSVSINVSGGAAPYTIVITDDFGNLVPLDTKEAEKLVFTSDREGSLSEEVSRVEINSLADFSKEILTASGLAAGSYDVVITDKNNCKLTEEFEILPGLEVVATISGIDGPVCPATEVVFTAPAMDSYSWSVTGNGAISGAADQQSVTVVAGQNCDEGFTVSLVVSKDDCNNNSEKTINVNAVDPVTLTVPADETIEACTSQAAVNDAFATWLSGVSFSGGCSATISNNNVGAPDACGGSTSVTWTVISDCGVNVEKSTTFTVTDAPALVTNFPADKTIAACTSQDDIDAAFDSWLDEATVSGGCNVSFAAHNVPAEAPRACGGSATITWTVSSDCGADVNHSATFTVTPAPAVILTAPADYTVTSCMTQDAIQTEYNNWLASVTSSGGCDLDVTNNAPTTAPAACGGSITVTWTASSSCEADVTASATFSVPAPAELVINSPADINSRACDYTDQAELNDAFEEWINEFSVTGGCNAVLPDLSGYKAPDYLTDQTITVQFAIEDKCETKLISRTFDYTPAPSVSITGNEIISCTTTQITLVADTDDAVTYLWSTGSTASSIDVTEGGDYSVTVKTSNGCTSSDEVTVLKDVASPSVAITGNETINCTTTEITLTASTTDDVTYLWSTGSTDSSIDVTEGGDYSVTVKTANGCTSSDEVTVLKDVASPSVAITGNETINCETAEITLTASTTDDVTFLWSTGSTASSINVTEGGDYSVTVKTANGCTSSDQVTVVKDVAAPSVAITGNETINCETAEITLVADTDDAVTFLWNTGSIENSIDVTEGGDYSVTVKTSNGCTSSDEVTVVKDVAAPSVAITGNKTINCETAEITLTASTTDDVTFLWSTGSTESSINVTEGGDYSVTVKTSNGCTSSDEVTVVKDVAAPSVAITGNKTINCETTEITLTASTTDDVTFLWSTGSTESSINVTEGGDYSVTVKTSNGCTSSDEVTVVKDVAAPSVAITGNKTINCETTEITLVADTDDAVTYLWSTGSTESSINVTEGGVYSVTVKTSNGCTSSDEVTVLKDVAAPSVAITGNETINCETAEITLVADTDDAVTFLWNTGSIENSIDVTEGGDYSVTVKTANGCTSSDQVTVVKDVAAPSVSITGNEIIDCTTTMITLVADSDDTVSYLWSTGSTASSIDVTEGGDYSVTVKTSNGCTSSDEVTVVKDVASPSVAITGNETINCTTTEITLTASTTDDVTYLWSTGSTASSIDVTDGGDYSVTVTAANGCTFSDQVSVVKDDAAPSITLADPATLTCSTNSVTLTATVADGVTVVWDDDAKTEGTELTVSVPGTYTAIAIAANGCESEASVAVEQDITAPTVEISGNQLLTCTTQEITLTAINSDDVVINVWSTGENHFGLNTTVTEPGVYTVRAFSANGCSSETSVTVEQDVTPPVVSHNPIAPVCIDELPLLLGDGSYSGAGVYEAEGNFFFSADAAGSYQITYTETGDNGCEGSVFINIAVNALPEVSCPDPINIGVMAQPIILTGGMPEGGTYAGNGVENGVFNPEIAGVGEHTLTYTYSNEEGCAASCEFVVTVISMPDFSCIPDMEVCHNDLPVMFDQSSYEGGIYSGEGVVDGMFDPQSVEPGEYVLTYTLTDPFGYVYSCNFIATVHPAPEVTLSAFAPACSSTVVTLSGGMPLGGAYYLDGAEITEINTEELAAGMYDITYAYTSEFGCTSEATASLEILQSPCFEVTATDISCYGAEDGAITVDIDDNCGEVVNICIEYENEDLDKCISDKMLGESSYTGLIAGTYYIVVTGANGCVTVESVTISEPELLEATAIADEMALCPDAETTITVSATGGTGEYTGTGVFTAGPGIHEFIVADENGCETIAQVTIEELPAPCVEISYADVSCNGSEDGRIAVNITCGNVVDICLMYPDDSDDKCSEEKIGGALFTGLLPGTYHVVVTDANGCITIEEVTISEPEILMVTAESTNPTCSDGFGTATVTSVSGGTEPYTFDWNGANPDALLSGTHILTVTDKNGCEAYAEVTVTAPDALVAVTEVEQPYCHDESGSAEITVTGGNMPYEIHWGDLNPEDLAEGEYQIMVTDANGCETMASFEIVNPPALQMEAEINHLEFFGDGTGAISLSVTGGNPPYFYMWDNGEVTASIENLQDGDYFVTVFDNNGCFISETYTVTFENMPLDLGVTIEVNNQTPDPEEVDELTFALVITNNDEALGANGVLVKNIIPESFPFIARIDDGTSGDFDPETGVWNIGTLAPGEHRILVYKTQMLLTEESKAEHSGTNAAYIIGCEQVDYNPANDSDEVVVTLGESSGGDDNGIESNGSMAAQLALRNHRRLVDSNPIARDERILKMESFDQVGMLTGQLKTATLNGHYSSGIGMLLPENGPANTKAFVSTPADLLGITNASEIFSVDYLQENNARRAAILAISTESSSVYEHTKVICDRLMGGELQSIEMVQIAGKPFILSHLVHPNGYVDYAISFIAQRKDGEFEIDNRWYNEEYRLTNADDIFNFQVWSVTPAFTRELVEEIISAMEQNGGVSFRTETEVPQIPQVYVHSGRYTNGGLLLNLVNKVGADQITIHGSKTLYENAQREPMDLTIDIPVDEFVEVFVPTGFLFDAGFSIRNNKDNAPDVLYYADGAWMFDYDPGNAEVSNFATEAETNQVEAIDQKVERDASFSGKVRTWASMFRSLSPRNMPVDMTAFDQVVFNAHGEGTIEVMLAKDGIDAWSEQYRTTITLTAQPREYRIQFADLINKEGVSGFTAEDVVSVIFNPLGNGAVASNFDVNVSNLHFANSSFVIAKNAIFYPAYPNPFSSNTNMDLTITQESHVKIEILNVFGQVVEVLANDEMSIGTYKLNWNPGTHRAGVYMIRMTVGSDTYTSKVIYQK